MKVTPSLRCYDFLIIIELNSENFYRINRFDKKQIKLLPYIIKQVFIIIIFQYVNE